jgi:hypothetical protein
MEVAGYHPVRNWIRSKYPAGRLSEKPTAVGWRSLGTIIPYGELEDGDIKAH